MKKTLLIPVSCLLIFSCASLTPSGQFDSYNSKIGGKTDVQLCIDSALIGTNQNYYDVIKKEIDSRSLDCSQYSAQVDSAVGQTQSTQSAMLIIIGVLSVLFGFASGASG